MAETLRYGTKHYPIHLNKEVYLSTVIVQVFIQSITFQEHYLCLRKLFQHLTSRLIKLDIVLIKQVNNTNQIFVALTIFKTQINRHRQQRADITSLLCLQQLLQPSPFSFLEKCTKGMPNKKTHFNNCTIMCSYTGIISHAMKFQTRVTGLLHSDVIDFS